MGHVIAASMHVASHGVGNHQKTTRINRGCVRTESWSRTPPIAIQKDVTINVTLSGKNIRCQGLHQPTVANRPGAKMKPANALFTVKFRHNNTFHHPRPETASFPCFLACTTTSTNAALFRTPAKCHQTIEASREVVEMPANKR